MELDLDHEAIARPGQLCSVCKPTLDFYVNNLATMEYIQRPVGPPEHLLGPNSSFRKHHVSISDMRIAVTQGCHLCAKLAYRPESIPHEASNQQIYITCSREASHATPYLVILWYLDGVGDSTSWTKASSVPFRRQYTEENQDFMLRYPYAYSEDQKPLWCVSTGSSILRKLMADWLHQCIETHESCNKRLEGEMPTRLLDLNAFVDDEDLRLVLNPRLAVHSYAALSYCWGDRVTTKLQRSNLDDFTSRIPLRYLPKTLREAVEVCRGLEIRYLWVDALCIVQNDIEDFEREVLRMGSIYAGALVTIAAADSEHCDSGLYRYRHPLMHGNFWLESHSEKLALIPDLSDEFEQHDLRDTLLSKRAWAFQERMMAPRTIHFTKTEIVWECRERAFCPRCSHYRDTTPLYEFKTKFTEMRPVSGELATTVEMQHLWFSTVADYACTNLTREDDRLSALAGIAQLVSQGSNCEASHGLWLHLFLGEILWYIIDTKEVKCREVGRADAPSWAWHRNGPTRITHSWYGRGDQMLYICNFTTLPRPTPFGQLSSLQPASFKVRGGLHTCRVTVTKWNGTAEFSLKQTGHGEHTVGPWSAPQGHYYPWNVYFYPDRDMIEQDVICLTLRRTFADFEYWCRSSDHGLVLTAVDTDKRIYRRIGFFTAFLDIEVPWTREEEEVEIV